MSGMTVCAYRSSENFFQIFVTRHNSSYNQFDQFVFYVFFNFSLTEHFGSHWLNYKATNLSKSRTSNNAKTIFVGTKMSFMVMISWLKVYILEFVLYSFSTYSSSENDFFKCIASLQSTSSLNSYIRPLPSSSVCTSHHQWSAFWGPFNLSRLHYYYLSNLIYEYIHI